MIRLTCLCLSTALLSQALPACPEQAPPPPTSSERGTIVTRAQSNASGPVAPAGSVTLSAEVDSDALVTAFNWVQTQGPGVKLETADKAQASFAAPSFETEQTLRFRVSTTNLSGDVGGADVTVVIQADPNFGFDSGSGSGGGSGVARPVARAGVDKLVEVGTTVTLDGSASTGRNLTFLWRQTSGPTVTLATPTAVTTTFGAPASFDANASQLGFELVVRDASGLTGRDAITVRLRDRDGSTDGEQTRVRFETTMGNFTMELENDLAPNTVANFLQYVDDDFYDNTIIHRVVSGFVVQGGGFSAGLVRKETRDPVQSEASNGLSNVRETVAMALFGGDPDSGTSQYFINLVDNVFLDEQEFTVFARIVEGMDVVDRIATVPVSTRNGMEDVPVTDIVVRDVVRVEP